MAVLVSGALGLALPSGSVLAATAPHTASGNVVKVGRAGTCMDIEFGFTGCMQGDPDQKWTEDSATGGTYKFENSSYYGSPHCLTVDKSGSEYGFGFDQCAAGSGSQRFTLLSSTGGTYKIEQDIAGNRVCLTWPPAPNVFIACAPGDGSQRWDITPSP